MFICQLCGETIGPRVAEKKVTIESRKVTHLDPAPKDYTGSKVYVDGKPFIATQGNQIVKEIAVCATCHQRFEK